MGKQNCDIVCLVISVERQTRQDLDEICKQIGVTAFFAADNLEAWDVLKNNDKIRFTIIDDVSSCAFSFIADTQSSDSVASGMNFVLLCAKATVEVVVQAMRSGFRDVLENPVTARKLSAIVNRFMKIDGDGRESTDSLTTGARFNSNGDKSLLLSKDSQQLALRKLRNLISMYNRRSLLFKNARFSDPSWHMLLALTRARLTGDTMTVVDVCDSSRVALTTALRHLDILEKDGLVSRMKDTFDGRRYFIIINEDALISVCNSLIEKRNLVINL